ncbi:uncharacterized protein LOC116343864 isoform X2 [Contarinia nasturtii]|uniref:uncharacterized protein LOC116343864 isoform X2 n=1 Tax=Contarinia nasturtii TaxID=265458 RepID=UPI0012D3B5CF|nr:uncharacterized protein LOC116343864 isoform X2 [Contarinia nasturtii]
MKFLCIFTIVFLCGTVFSSDNEPQVNEWDWTDEITRQKCISVRLAASLNITYPTEDGKVSHTIYNIPSNTSWNIIGSCSDGVADQNITVEWTEPNYSKTGDTRNSINLTFKFYDNTNLYSLNAISFEINATIFENGSDQLSNYLYVGDDFWAPEGWSYNCNKTQEYELSGVNRRYILGSIILSNMQFEASLTSSVDGLFRQSVQCRVDDFETKVVFISIAGVVVLFISIGIYIYFHRFRL